MTQIPSIPLRLTIGITGHRKLDNEARIREAVRSLVKSIKSTYKGNERTPVKLSVLSALAEGADRLVAEEVLSCDPHSELRIILPLVDEEYLEDFETEASREQFRRLLQGARNPKSLRNRPLKEEYPAEMLTDARRQAYEDVGCFVVDHCDLLVAVWDGKAARGPGGTARIIEYARKTGCPVYVIDAHEPKAKPFDIRMNHDALYSRIDTWNKYCATGSTKTDARGDYEENVFQSLFPDGFNPKAMLNGPKKEALTKCLAPHYTTASRLAKQYQSRYKLMGNAIFFLAFIAISGVALAEIFLRENKGLFLSAFWLEFILLFIIVGIVHYDKKTGHFHKNWIECRFLAERLRTAFYCCICGLEKSPAFVTRRVQGEMLENRWMDFVFNEILTQMPDVSSSDSFDAGNFSNYIQIAWIDNQIHYHHQKAESCNKTYHRLEKICECVFYLALSTAFFHIVTHPMHNHILDQVLTLAALVLPALAATLEGIRSIREYKRLSIRSQQIERRIMNLKKQFHLMTPQKLETIIAQMEQLMLEESEDWLSFMSPAELYKVA